MRSKLTCVVVALAVLVGSSTGVRAEDKKPVKPEKVAASVSGAVKKIDDKANTITLLIPTEKTKTPEEQTFTLAADVKFAVSGNKEAKLSDIQADKSATLILNADKKVVAVVQADKGVKGEKTPGISGQVKKIDDKAITLSVVTQKGQPAEDQTFTLAADVRFAVTGNKEAKLSDIQVDKPATVMLNADKKVVGVAQFVGGDKGEKTPGVNGQVKKIDATANTITLSVVTQKGQPAEDQTFTLLADAQIVVAGVKQAKLSDIQVDKPANLQLNADKKVTVAAQGGGDKGNKVPGVNGQVKKVDTTANTITLSVVTQKGQPAEDQTFTLLADAKIVVAGVKEAKLGDLQVDKPANLQLNADKKVTVAAQGGGDKPNKGEKGTAGISGQVKKVDDKANTITISVVPQKGQPAEDQTFTLAADVKIMVEGKEVKLGEVATDKPANLSLNADKKVVVLAQGKGQKPQK